MEKNLEELQKEWSVKANTIFSDLLYGGNTAGEDKNREFFNVLAGGMVNGGTDQCDGDFWFSYTKFVYEKDKNFKIHCPMGVYHPIYLGGSNDFMLNYPAELPHYWTEQIEHIVGNCFNGITKKLGKNMRIDMWRLLEKDRAIRFCVGPLKIKLVEKDENDANDVFFGVESMVDLSFEIDGVNFVGNVDGRYSISFENPDVWEVVDDKILKYFN